MAIFLAFVLIVLGATLLGLGGIIMAVRQGARSVLDSFPRGLHNLMAESDPQVRKAMKLLETLPRISWIVGGIGLLLFLLGVGVIHNPLVQLFILVLAIGGSVLAYKNRTKLSGLVQKQLMDQFQKQMVNAPVRAMQEQVARRRGNAPSRRPSGTKPSKSSRTIKNK